MEESKIDSRQFEVRNVAGHDYIVIDKKDFKMVETDNVYILESRL